MFLSCNHASHINFKVPSPNKGEMRVILFLEFPAICLVTLKMWKVSQTRSCGSESWFWWEQSGGHVEWRGQLSPSLFKKCQWYLSTTDSNWAMHWPISSFWRKSRSGNLFRVKPTAPSPIRCVEEVAGWKAVYRDIVPMVEYEDSCCDRIWG